MKDKDKQPSAPKAVASPVSKLDSAIVTFDVELPFEMRFHLRMPDDVQFGNPIEATVTLQNGTKGDVVCDVSPSGKVPIDVRNAKGDRVERTPFGESATTKVFSPKEDIVILGGGHPTQSGVLPNGKSWTWQLDLNQCFKLTPGRYTVVVPGVRKDLEVLKAG